MCHLTATRQVMMTPATLDDYRKQAYAVLNHYAATDDEKADRVNFNFMARGEPLENPTVLSQWDAIRDMVDDPCTMLAVEPRFNVSTIMPTSLLQHSTKLQPIFGMEANNTAIYYSLYSMKDAFRRRWLPKAMDPELALDMLAAWQHYTGGEVVLHWAFIAGENDDPETLEEIVEAVRLRGMTPRFNLVRYNPYSDRQGREPSEAILQRNLDILSRGFRTPASRIVPRVGFDVKASCGMFIERDQAHG